MEASIKKVIAIFEWNRPHYLRLCLECVKRLIGLENWKVFVFLDGEHNSNFYSALSSMSLTVVQRPKRLDSAGNVLEGLKSLADAGFEQILWFDADDIMRKDSLIYLESLPREKNVAWDSLICPPKGMEHMAFTQRGNRIYTDLIPDLYQYWKHGDYAGKKPQGHPLPVPFPASDGICWAWTEDRSYRTRWTPDFSYMLHVGVVGMHSDGKDVEERIFRGKPDEWIGYALEEYARRSHPMFWPENYQHL